MMRAPKAVILSALAAVAVLAVRATSAGPDKRERPEREAAIARLQTRSLFSWHYAPPQLDDAFSNRIFEVYLKRLDPQKRFLLQSDADSLARFRNLLDDHLRTGDFSFAEAANAVLDRRVAEARALARELIRAGLDLDVPDSIATDARKYAYAADTRERRRLWTRLLKLQILSRIEGRGAESDDDAEADSSASRPLVRPDTAALRDARAYVERSLERNFARMIREDRFERVAVYLGAVANAFDPHTAYLKPEGREEFNMAMSGTLEGIGATLREDDGYIRVVAIIPGSASWRQRELKAEDKILKVAQGGEEPVDLADASVQEAVRLIRGPKGTEVRLTVRKPDGQTKVISIIRDVVVVEESYAKSSLLEAPGSDLKVGYISLPSFYHDFQNPKGRNSTSDVRRELERLKAQGAGAIVLDLRGNGGGSLDDAVKMAGLFLPWGPMVQVRDRQGAGNVLEDMDPSVMFDGPLVVMVNTFSASASEILAAAMQDYGRAVIFGTDTTFGKGTVQTLLDLDNLAAPAEASLKPLGSLKLNIQKFYRVNGGSTQFHGVVPDILIPDTYTNLDVGEKSLDNALPWDAARPLRIQRWFDPPPLPELQSKSRSRVARSAYFKRLNSTLRIRQARRENEHVALTLDRYLAERERNRVEGDSLEALHKQATGLIATLLISQNAAFAADSVEQVKARDWKDQLAKDFYLREAVDVLGDWAGTRK
jgi:carboxyl-terminal processing protease